jgi:hypothetical protein
MQRKPDEPQVRQKLCLPVGVAQQFVMQTPP